MQVQNMTASSSNHAVYELAPTAQDLDTAITAPDGFESPSDRYPVSAAPRSMGLEPPCSSQAATQALPTLPNLKECGEVNVRALQLHDEAVVGDCVNYGRLIMAGALYRLVLDSLPVIETRYELLRDMLNSLRNSYATMMRDLGRHDRAIKLFEEIAADQMAQTDPNSGATLVNLANTLLKGGRLEEALGPAHRALEWAGMVMVGAYHAMVAESNSVFYREMFEQGRESRLNSLNLLHEIREAIATEQEGPDLPASDASRLEILALFRQHLGAEHPETLHVEAVVANNRAFARMQQGLYADAVPLLKEALAVAIRLSNADLHAFFSKRLHACGAATTEASTAD